MVVSRSPPPVRRSPRKNENSTPGSPANYPISTAQASNEAEFPTLDQMAAATRENSAPAAPLPSSARKAASSTSSSTTIPSSLPRPVSKQLVTDADSTRRAGRSSLTDTAIQRARQLAGDETPAGVSKARAARSAAGSQNDVDDSTDEKAHPLERHQSAKIVVDVEKQQMPTLDTASSATDAGYDFDKYLEGNIDPFNRASRVNVRRDDSRPLPAPSDEADDSGDTTARRAGTAPVELTPRIQQNKIAATSTPLMSPHAGPSLSSRKLGHFKALPSATTGVAALTFDAAADTSKSRFDPGSRSDRLQEMELSQLRKKHATALHDLSAAQEALSSAREESEGWASECSGLQAQLSALQAAAARESRTSRDAQLRLAHYKSEVDDRAWRMHCHSQRTTQLQTELEYAKNESQFAESNLAEIQFDWERSKDDLRVRLMLECKRADLLVLHYKSAVQTGVQNKKRLALKTRAIADLEQENEKLAAQLEQQQSSKSSSDALKLVRQLESQVAQLNKELELMREKDEMMTETRKNWKIERKALQAEMALLQAADKVKVKTAATPMSTSETGAAVRRQQERQEYQPSSDPASGDKIRKHTNRKPMQGASEIEPPSDYVDNVANQAQKSKPKQASTKPAQAPKPTKPVSKNWRDEVAITDSESESDASEDERRQKQKRSSGKSIIPKKATTAKVKSKPKPTVGIEYDDQTADPSATPMIRNAGANKRILGATQRDDEEDQDHSVLASKFGRDKTNLITVVHQSKIAANEAQPRKKKRKLLGAGGASSGGAGGPSSGWGAETEGLGPNFDIPMELSPIKAAPTGSAGRGLLNGFSGFGAASGRNGPFA